MPWIHESTTKSGKTTYKVVVRLKGATTQTATFKKKTDAKRWAQQIEASIREGRHFKTVEAKKHTLADLIKRYKQEILPNKPKSELKQGRQLGWWQQRIGERLLAEITPALISQCKEELLNGMTPRGKKRSNSTVVRYLAVLSHVFTIAVKEYGWVDDNPFRKVVKPKEPRGRVRFLDKIERERLLEACRGSHNPHLYLIVILALSTGMRQSEILNLLWRDVDLERARIVLHETKNGERRVVPLAGHALELLKKYREQSSHLSLLFPRPTNPLRSLDLRSSWEYALHKAQIFDFKFHDLRHTAASYLAMNGASLAEIAEILGHKTLQMVKRYAHHSEAHTAGVVSRMNQEIFGQL